MECVVFIKTFASMYVGDFVHKLRRGKLFGGASGTSRCRPADASALATSLPTVCRMLYTVYRGPV